jgi:hypothetical protein
MHSEVGRAAQAPTPIGAVMGPFGNPDGSRAALQDVLSHFVDFEDAPSHAALATPADDLSARVLVGKMGAGKTVYMRRFQAAAKKNLSLYADSIQEDLPSTESIVRICHWYRDAVLTEKWMLLWRRAIIRSLVTHLLCDKELAANVTEDEADLIWDDFGDLVRRSRTPLSVYSQLNEIILGYDNQRQLAAYIQAPEWEELEHVVGDILRRSPPICFYIDAVDEEFANAPMYWMRCQEGLFLQVMRLLRNPRLGGRLHLIISLRDIVLSTVLRGEHQNRYRGESHIRVLDWDRAAIQYFLHDKLARLPRQYWCQPDASSRGVSEWLGRSTVRNEVRLVDEPVEDYLLRHTRLLPRDIIMLGNLLCDGVSRAREQGLPSLTDATIRDLVHRAGRWFGDQQIAVCANHIASDTMTPEASKHGFSAVFTGEAGYRRGIEADLRSYLAAFKYDRIDGDTREDAVTAARRSFEGRTDVLTVLWQNGLLGYEERPGAEMAIFYSVSDMDRFQFPTEAPIYVLHPCVLDAVSGIRGKGSPVRAYAT